MNLTQLLSRSRIRLDDTVEPYLWSDALLTDFLDEAEKEACIRARLLRYDSDTVDENIAVTTGEPNYTVPAYVFDVDRVKVGDRVLTETTHEELDEEFGLRWEALEGRVIAYILEGSALRLVRIPAEDATAYLRGYRTPSVPLSTKDTPEIPERYHEQLVEWALHRAFSIPDTDMEDAARSAAHLVAFERAFGIRNSANVDRKHASARRRTVRFAGYWP